MHMQIIAYDLDKPGQDYTDLIEVIKKSYPTHYHIQRSVWLVETAEAAGQIRDRLLPYLDRNDQMFVARLQGNAAWTGYPDNGSQWMKTKLEAYASSL